MSANEPRDHHFVPQFYLRNFAFDEGRRKVMAVAKYGDRAVWARRSIESIGYERDFYVHVEDGVPVSVETAINRRIETPIADSDTWRKVVEGRSHQLDKSDRPILYALVRHLEVRTPHALQTYRELAEMAANPNSEMPFSDDERGEHALLRANPGLERAKLNFMATKTSWASSAFDEASIIVMRSPIPFRTSTTPVMTIRSGEREATARSLPGLTPFQRLLALNPTTAISVVDGKSGEFENMEVPAEVAIGFNRNRLAQFTYFPRVQHLLTSRDDLVKDMIWAHYELVHESDRKVSFLRCQKIGTLPGLP